VLLAAALSCSGGGGGAAPSGSISGKVTVGGPINGAVELQVALLSEPGGAILETATAGHVTSTASASVSGRDLDFSFSDLDLATYRVAVISQNGGAPTYWFTSDPIALSAGAPSVANFEEQMSFSGVGPWGTISGVALFVTNGSTSWPDPSLLVFVGFNKVAEPTNILQWLVSEADVNHGELIFNVDHLDFGTYNVGLYGYNPVTHAVSVYGAFDETVTISASDVNATNVNFPADFAGDPGTDPELGSISGTITFTGPLPSGLFISVGANTIPPQMGAPIASFDVAPEDLDASQQVHYVLAGLPDDDYAVAIFSYDFATHQATYFGQYDTAITVDPGNLHHAGIDFDADVSLLSGL